MFNNDEHNDHLMDMINECKGIINVVNKGYLNIFELLQNIFQIEVKDLTDKDLTFMDQLIKALNHTNGLSARFFSELSKEGFLRKGCKKDLLDLRINIRSMRETINDIENKLIDSDEDVNGLINSLLTQF